MTDTDTDTATPRPANTGSSSTAAGPGPARPAAPGRRRGGRVVFWLFVLALLAVLGWRGWLWWQVQQADQRDAERVQVQQSHALESRIDALRRDQRAQAKRIQQADTTNRVLRDEILGVGERAALLEDSVEKLADPARNGIQALRLDEVELLLTTGMQRLQLAGDLAGARNAYALAAGVLNGVDDPAWIDLRQTLAQERAALDAAGSDPRLRASAGLDAFAQQLAPPSPVAVARHDEALPWWRRALSRVVQVRPVDRDVVVAPDDRATGYAALQLEITLARAALERRDVAAWQSALDRSDTWLTRLWPDSPERRQQRAQLQSLRKLPLTISVPGLGSSLQQLQALRATR